MNSLFDSQRELILYGLHVLRLHNRWSVDGNFLFLKNTEKEDREVVLELNATGTIQKRFVLKNADEQQYARAVELFKQQFASIKIEGPRQNSRGPEFIVTFRGDYPGFLSLQTFMNKIWHDLGLDGYAMGGV